MFNPNFVFWNFIMLFEIDSDDGSATFNKCSPQIKRCHFAPIISDRHVFIV